MVTFLLIIIYICFISLGLPDSLLGSAWPVIHVDFNVPLSYMGIVAMVISVCTIISSVFADKLIRKLGTRMLVFGSILMTAFALLGFYFANHFWVMLLVAIPYGLGAGSVDSALNNYVALHYSSKHMSWLHCFWGVGTLVGPYAMSYAITSAQGWRLGYLIVAIIQFAIAVVVLITLPVWKKVKFKNEEEEDIIPAKLTFKQKFSIKGVAFVFIAFFAYCAMEATAMSWSSTYFVEAKGISEEIAAALGSMFYIGITVGRFVCGFISGKLGDKKLIRIGSIIIIPGIILIALPITQPIVAIIGIILVGIGCAPIYPSIIHSTPSNFGKANSQAIIGLQMAFAYTGSTLMSPLFGVIANYVNIKLFPAYLGLFFVLFVTMIEILNKKMKEKEQVN